MWKRTVLGFGVVALVAVGGTLGCNSNEDSGEVFESDDPGRGTHSGGGDDGFEDGAPDDEGSDDEPTITEADIVQVEGNRLYSLSRTQGLSVIDIAKPDSLALLGRFRIQAEPFEMYLRGDVVVAMFTNFAREVVDEKTNIREWVWTSRIVAVDVANPKAVREIGSFELPGEISDSRIVGDKLYVVSFESGSCWSCGSVPTTVVTSLDVADPTSIRRVDELELASDKQHWGSDKRSVTVTPERIYVAGPEGRSNGQSRSSIRVVDISNPSGELALGASVEAMGTIKSRWQMDEYEGVLRVISQPDEWQSVPEVQTFAIASSSELTKLGSLPLTLPRPEELKSARFDGSRAYAITFQRTDPLFTIDLENPEAPVQRGELEMPGWVVHMEPRGERLYGLGFDDDNDEGSLHVSVFDVSNLSKPRMLDRVNFGARWGGRFGEDQDRIHKAFRLLPDAGLILAPFTSSYGWGSCSRSTGVQLIDVVGDSLKKRGVAQAPGARRALLHEGRLLTVGDQRAQLFDIDDRDEPKAVATAHIAHPADRLRPLGDNLVRIVNDWTVGGASLQIVPKSAPNLDEPLASLELDAGLFALGSNFCGAYHFDTARYFVNGSYLYALVPSTRSDRRGTLVFVVDIDNPKALKVIHQAEHPFRIADFDATGQSWNSQLIELGAHALQRGSTIALLETFSPYSEEATRGFVHLLDLSIPQAPRQTTIELPEAEGRTPLQIHGDTLMVGRWSPVPEKPSRVRFYVDRIDLSSNAPRLLPPVNVPGSLLSFDEGSQHLVTVDYQREVRPASSWEDCKTGKFDRMARICTIVHRSLELLAIEGDRAVRKGREPLSGGYRVQSAALGDDRVYFEKQTRWDDYCAFNPCDKDGPKQLVVVGGARQGKLRVVSAELSTHVYDDILTAVAPLGQRLVVSGTHTASASILDARNLDELTTIALGEPSGYAFDIVIDKDRAFLALGSDGVEAFPLPQ